MKKSVKVIGMIAVLLLVAGLSFYVGNAESFQGRLTKISTCKIVFENFDPNPSTVVKYGSDIDFKWNGPGCSRYAFTQYLLCFENATNPADFACLGVYPDSNHKKLSLDDWKFIDQEMRTSRSQKSVKLNWFVQSRFGNSSNGEELKTTPWKFSYSR